VAQAEVLNQESLAKQVLHETFGYQQFRPARKPSLKRCWKAVIAWW
jgi:hypothetical protein